MTATPDWTPTDGGEQTALWDDSMAALIADVVLVKAAHRRIERTAAKILAARLTATVPGAAYLEVETTDDGGGDYLAPVSLLDADQHVTHDREELEGLPVWEDIRYLTEKMTTDGAWTECRGRSTTRIDTMLLDLAAAAAVTP